MRETCAVGLSGSIDILLRFKMLVTSTISYSKICRSSNLQSSADALQTIATPSCKRCVRGSFHLIHDRKNHL